MNQADLKKLSTAERLHLMDFLWETLLEDAEKLSSPNWHGEMLRERIAKIEKGEAKLISLDELKSRRPV